MSKSSVTVITSCTNENQAAGAIVKSIYPDCYVMTANYNRDIKYGSIPLESTIFMIGFNLPIKEMQSLAHRYDLIYITNHESAIREAKVVGFDVKGLRDVNHASCILTWKYLKSEEPIPPALQDIADYATWKFVKDNNDNPLFLNYALALCDLSPNYNMTFWNKLFTESSMYNSLIERGKLLDQYISLQNKICCNDTAYEISIDSYTTEMFDTHITRKCLVANSKLTNSLFFKSQLEAEPNYYDMLISYNWFYNISKFRISFYSNNKNVNVGEFARHFNGGGGPGVAGAALTNLPFVQGKRHCLPPPLTNIYQACDEMEDKYDVVSQYVNSGNRIVLMSQSFDVMIGGKKYLCMNYPLLKHQVFNASSTLYEYAGTISYVWTAYGVYRIVFRPLDLSIADTAIYEGSRTQDALIEIKGEKYYIYYATELPFKIPFKETNKY